jgi:hypothetical protein
MLVQKSMRKNFIRKNSLATNFTILYPNLQKIFRFSDIYEIFVF